MTNEEKLQAEKLTADSIAGMRGYMSVIGSKTDEEELLTFLRETFFPVYSRHLNSFTTGLQFAYPDLAIYENKDFQTVYMAMNEIMVSSCNPQRFVGGKWVPAPPEVIEALRNRLKTAVANMPAAIGALDKVEQALRETPSE
jgi:hypothetical protein